MDYWKRCMYAAFGLQHALAKEGVVSELVTGDMLCFVLYKESRTPGLEGYGPGTPEKPAHFWVETADAILDLGPHYLPHEARRPLVAMPIIRWSKGAGLPYILRYREQARYGLGTNLRAEPAMMERLDLFLSHCESSAPRANGSTASWELTTMDSVKMAAKRADLWAKAAARFEEWIDPAALPF